VTDPERPGPRVALYARVSTTDQSTEAQVRDLTDYAARMGWPFAPELVFREEGVSGLRTSRPELDRLRALVRDRRVDTVLSTKIDRLGRSVRGVLDFYEEAAAKGVRVICTSQGFDTETAVGRLIRDVLASVASFERELIVERTHAGLRRARAEGKTLGRPRTETSKETLRQIVALRDERKLSWRQIAQHVRVPTSRVRRLYHAVSESVGSMEGGSGGVSKVPTPAPTGNPPPTEPVPDGGEGPPSGKRPILVREA
jgi:DNA invertase Pin-like site-specific DNA recombinase